MNNTIEDNEPQKEWELHTTWYAVYTARQALVDALYAIFVRPFEPFLLSILEWLYKRMARG